MPTLSQSESILLGKVLEKSLEPVIKNEKYKYSFSESYEELLTRPDYLIFDGDTPIASVAVTCTQDNETMNKKRWRYIDEVFQLKSYFGPELLTINCEFGDHSAYVRSEVNLANVFFDKSIYVSDFKVGKRFLAYAEELVKDTSKNAEQLTEELTVASVWKDMATEFASALKQILLNRNSIVLNNKLLNIWRIESSDYKEQLEKVKKLSFKEYSTYLRYCVLKGIEAGPDNMKKIMEATENKSAISDDIVEVCKRIGVSTVSKIGGKYINDEKLISTIEAGMTYQEYLEIESDILNYEPLKYAVRDLRNFSVVEDMCDVVFEVLEKEETLSKEFKEAFQKENYKNIDHNRVWLLDMILVYLDIPTNYLNRTYAQRYGREGITTKVEHYISKTDMGKNFFADEKLLDEFCNNLAELVLELKNNIINLPEKNEVIKKYFDKKIVSIGNMHYVNPMQRYVELLLRRHNICFSKNGLPSAISGIDGIPNSMSNIHEIYQFEYKGKEYWLKSIAAYDGVKDKTREMAARGKMLQYSSPESEKRNVEMLFVYDGKWSSDLQKLLTLSGWKYIIPIFEFDSFLNEL